MTKAQKKTKSERQAELGKRHRERNVVGIAEELIEKGRPELAAELLDEPPPADENRRHEEFADVESAMEGDVAPMEGDEEDKKPSSVVKDVFKNRYIANAREHGIKGKAAKRSNWDWLAQEIAKFCLTDKHSIRMDDFVALLEANGIDHSKWTNRNRGWEGRFRMTGRVALQRYVAMDGVLKFPDGSEAKAPMEFILKYKAK